MHIDIRPHNVKISRAYSLELAQRIRETFRQTASRIARVIVHIRAELPSQVFGRECTVEVHLRDGAVSIGQERQRKLRPLFRRAVQRALQNMIYAMRPNPGGQALSLMPASIRSRPDIKGRAHSFKLRE